jgi:serine protease Do
MRRARPVGILLLIVSAVWLAGCATSEVPVEAPALWQDSGALPVAPELARLNDLLAQLADRMKPGLVQIRVRRAEPPRAEGQESPQPPPQHPQQPPQQPQQPPQRPPDDSRRSMGSGFVIREDGLIVTNAHVVNEADRIEVRLSDGRRFMGKLVGKDNRVDLAGVRLEGVNGLPALSLGDSNRTRVGEFVLALGNPFGLEQSVSFGIVGRKGAPLQVASPGFDFIQTDAVVNPGNSGGPLVNMAGEVVGVNTMAARGGSIGFAIPVNLVKALVPQLVAKGKVEWGWLGVGIDEVPEEEVAKFGLSEPRGVLVKNVMPGEPAEKGGLKANDVILSVDGDTVDGPRDLQRIISSSPPGKNVLLRVMREGKEAEVWVTVGVYKEPAERSAPRR